MNYQEYLSDSDFKDTLNKGCAEENEGMNIASDKENMVVRRKKTLSRND